MKILIGKFLKRLSEKLLPSVTLENDLIVVCDVDDTICIWNNVKWHEPSEGLIEILDETDGSSVYLKPHTAHIRLLKKYKTQGYTVIVWSAAGYRWAKSAVTALGLDDTVDLRMSKPLKYIDDLIGPEGIIGTRVYIPLHQVDKVIEPALPEDEE